MDWDVQGRNSVVYFDHSKAFAPQFQLLADKEHA
jgi:hypothetical protein